MSNQRVECRMTDNGQKQRGRLEKLALWHLGGLPIWKALWLSFQAFRDNYLSARCAQFAFYSMLVLAPMLILIIGLLAKLPINDVIGQILITLESNVPESAYNLIASQIKDIQETRTTSLMLISGVVLCFSGSRIFLTLGEGLNAAYGVPVRHMRWRLRFKSIVFVLGVVPLLLILMVLIVVGPTVIQWVYHLLEIPLEASYAAHAVRWVIVVLGLWVVTVVIHCWIPSARQPWYWLAPGTAFTVAGWVIASEGFRFYVENFAHYNQTYGALGGVIVVMLWLYMIGAVLLFGGQLNGVVYRAARANGSESDAK